uniref:B30.2/SPRY domain-containing protein n=1 Tax=Globodera pallida TaxID=36090 RepID=A0A183CFY0_GLOPA
MEQYQEQQQQKMQQYQKEQQQTIDELQKKRNQKSNLFQKGIPAFFTMKYNFKGKRKYHWTEVLENTKALMHTEAVAIFVVMPLRDGSKTFLDLMPPSKESLRLALATSNADALILSEAFLQIDQQLLCEILDRDELWISEEIAIWNAALRWADEKCHQNEKECSAENRRALLGPALYKIRFPLIPQKDFTEKIVPSGVLEEDEQVGVYQYHSHQDAGLPELYQLQFPTNGRALAGLTPENRWVARHEHLTLIDANELIVQSTGEKNGKHSSVSDSAARAKKLAVIRPAQLIVQFIGENSWNYSVLAEQPIPNDGIFYYEVTILEEGDGIYIGLATNEMPLSTHVGWDKGTYGYGNWGRFWGHEVKGCHHYDGHPFIRDGIPSFGVVNDVVGCGVDLKTRQIIYTKNGQQLETTDLEVDSAAELYPCVSLFKPGTKIEANFGKEKKFRFDIAKAFEN